MSDSSSVFRSAMMGGFNRQDVLAYLEDSARTHTEELNELGRRFDASQKELTETKASLKAAQEQSQAAQSEADACKSELGQSAAELNKLRVDYAELKSKIDSEISELSALKADREQYAVKLSDLQASIAEVDQAKIRIADIELEAYERAKKIEDAAISNAAMARMALTSLFAEAKKRFDQTKDDAGKTVFYISQEMDRLKGEMKNIPGFFETISGQIDALKFGTEKKSESDDAATKTDGCGDHMETYPAEDGTAAAEANTSYNSMDDMQFETLVYPLVEKTETFDDAGYDFEIIREGANDTSDEADEADEANVADKADSIL